MDKSRGAGHVIWRQESKVGMDMLQGKLDHPRTPQELRGGPIPLRNKDGEELSRK